MAQKKRKTTAKKAQEDKVVIKIASDEKKKSAKDNVVYKHHPGHFFAYAILIIIIIALIILGSKYVVNVEVSEKTDNNVPEITTEYPADSALDVNETEVILEEDVFVAAACGNSVPVENIICESELRADVCENAYDKDITTQWVAGSSCITGRSPCTVSNILRVTSQESFSAIKLLNRLEKDSYINRILLSYNNITDQEVRGGQTYTQKFWDITLNELTTDLQIEIVEIMGVGKYYSTGLAEVELYDFVSCAE